MARAKKPKVRARAAAHSLLAERHALALANLHADQADLTRFLELRTTIAEGLVRRESSLQAAARVRDRKVHAAVSDYDGHVQQARDDGPSGGNMAGRPRSADAGQTLVAALDSAHRDFAAAVVAAVSDGDASKADALAEQAAVLGRIRERGMSLTDLASMVELSPRQLSALLKVAGDGNQSGDGSVGLAGTVDAASIESSSAGEVLDETRGGPNSDRPCSSATSATSDRDQTVDPS